MPPQRPCYRVTRYITCSASFLPPPRQIWIRRRCSQRYCDVLESVELDRSNVLQQCLCSELPNSTRLARALTRVVGARTNHSGMRHSSECAGGNSAIRDVDLAIRFQQVAIPGPNCRESGVAGGSGMKFIPSAVSSCCRFTIAAVAVVPYDSFPNVHFNKD